MANSPGGSITFTRNTALPGSLLIGGTLATTATNVTLTINGNLLLESGSVVDNPGAIQVKGNYLDQGADILKNAPVKIAGHAPFVLHVDQLSATGSGLASTPTTEPAMIITWDALPGMSFHIEIASDLVHWTVANATVEEVAPGKYVARIPTISAHAFVRAIAD
jgi:hypothetical protein